jgi:hypothetical protein
METEWRPRQSRRSVAASLVAGILVAVLMIEASNSGLFGLPPASPPPGQVTLDGVIVDYFYALGSPRIFGSNQQQVCVNCPVTMPGGAEVTLGNLFNQSFPQNTTVEFWLNATSPIPFEEWTCFYSGSRPSNWPPTGCPFTVDYQQGEFGVVGGGLTISYPITFAVPDPAPYLPGGFDVQISISVIVTNAS